MQKDKANKRKNDHTFSMDFHQVLRPAGLVQANPDEKKSSVS